MPFYALKSHTISARNLCYWAKTGFLRGAQHCLIQNLKNNIDLHLKFPMSPIKENSGKEWGQEGVLHIFLWTVHLTQFM